MCVKPLTHMAKSAVVGHEKNESSPTSGDQGRSGPSGSLPPNKSSSKHEEWSGSPDGEPLQTPGQEGIIIPVRRTMTENDKRLTKTLTEGASALGPSQGNPCGHPWCPHTTQCDRPYQEHMLEWAIRSVEWHTAHNDSIALAYAVNRVNQHQRAMDDHDRVCEARERHMRERTNRANAKSKLGPWEFTLTYSPKEHGWNREEAKDAMRTACERLLRYYREEIEEFHAVGELTSTGQPHVHAWYKLDGGRRMTTKSFKRAYPIWDEKRKLGNGHVGGHHAPVKRTSDFAGYIEKDLDTSWLILNITNEPHEAEADVPEEEDDGTEVDSTAGPPEPPAQPHDRELR